MSRRTGLPLTIHVRPVAVILTVAAAALGVAVAALAVAAPAAAATAARETEPSAAATVVIPLSLEQAVGRAVASAPRLLALEARSRAAGEAERAIRADRLPAIDLYAGYDRHSHVPELSAPQPGGERLLIFPDLPDRYTSRIQATLPLYTGGRLSGGIAAAAGERDAAEDDRDTGLMDLVLETRSVYWALVTALASGQVLRDGLAAYDAHFKEAQDRFELGMAARNEVLAVQVERDRAVLALVRAEQAVEVARADLARLLDLDRPGNGGGRTSVEPSEPLDPPPAAPGASDTLIDAAMAARPDRRAMEARARAAEERIAVARAARRPSARMIAGYTLANPNRDILPLVDEWEDTWDAGLFMNFNLTDGGRAAAEVRQAEAEAEAARYLLADFDRALRFEVTRRALDLETAIAAIPVAERGREAAEENRRVTQDRYRAGAVPSSELLDAETAWLRAGLERIEVAVRAHLARAALDRAVGAPVPDGDS